VRVLLLDDDEDLREVMGDVLQAFSHERLVVDSFLHLVAAAERALACDVAILDINLGPAVPSGIDAYHWLRERGFAGKIVFLTGHAQSLGQVAAMGRELADGVRVMRKPITLEDLEQLLREVAT
jgi:CheY-like chemotaxis protein